VEGVKVVAGERTVSVRPDRMTYAPPKQAVNAGGSAQTVLQNLPSLQVSVDGSISYRGSEHVALRVNGEPVHLTGETLLGYLQGLPARAVRRVEVRPNPSAEYAPDGMAGIINIVLKRNLNPGWSGGATVGAEVDDDKQTGGNVSAHVGYRSQVWRFTTTYSHRRGGKEVLERRYRRVGQKAFDGPVGDVNAEDPILISQLGLRKERQRSHHLTSRFERQLSENTSLKIRTSLRTQPDQENGRLDFKQYEKDFNPALLERHFARRYDLTATQKGLGGRVSVDHSFRGDEHALSGRVRYRYDIISEEGDYFYHGLTESARTELGELGDQEAREADRLDKTRTTGSLSLDYTRSIRSLGVNVGYKGTARRFDADQRFVPAISPDFTSLPDSIVRPVVNYYQQIHAIYGTVSKEWERWELSAGLRVERARRHSRFARRIQTPDSLRTERRQVYEDVDVHLYPSLALTYNVPDRWQVQLSYSGRVNRPSFWHLNPLESNENPLFHKSGNPGLDAEQVRSVELAGTWGLGAGSITVTPYLRQRRNRISRVDSIETNTKVYRGVGEVTVNERTSRIGFVNLSSSLTYGVEALAVFDWDALSGSISGNLYRAVTNGSSFYSDLSSDALAASVQAALQISLWDGGVLELSQFVRPAMDLPGGSLGRDLRTTVAFEQDMFGGDGHLRLRASNLLGSGSPNVVRNAGPTTLWKDFEDEPRTVSLSFEYTLGEEPAEQP